VLVSFEYKVQLTSAGSLTPPGFVTVNVAPGETTAGSTSIKVKSLLVSSMHTTRTSPVGLISPRSVHVVVVVAQIPG
jgi:hypothetical protein